MGNLTLKPSGRVGSGKAQTLDEYEEGSVMDSIDMPRRQFLGQSVGMWEDSIRSNLVTKAAADDYAEKNYQYLIHPIVPHL